MREKATRLGRQCDELTHAFGRVDQAVAAMKYNCPAGDDLRQVVAERRARLHRLVEEIRTLQHALAREAGDLEASQREWARAFRLLGGT